MAHIYGGAGEDTLVIARIEKGNQLVATGQLGDWYRVLGDKNDTGWISSHAVKIKTDEDIKIQVEPAKPTVIKIFQKESYENILINISMNILRARPGTLKVVSWPPNPGCFPKPKGLLLRWKLQDTLRKGIFFCQNPLNS